MEVLHRRFEGGGVRVLSLAAARSWLARTGAPLRRRFCLKKRLPLHHLIPGNPCPSTLLLLRRRRRFCVGISLFLSLALSVLAS
ncbi:PMD domain-containing protein [Psidium guajava]|nr:PMD domain-containing protein [Psidium guajava]